MNKRNVYIYTILSVLVSFFIKLKLLDKNLFSIDSKDLANNVFYWTMTIVFVCTIILREKKDRQLLYEIDDVMNDLKNINLENINDEFEKTNIKLLDKKKYKNLSEIWNSYNDTIMILKNGKVCQTVDAELFYNSDSLMKEKMNFKLLNYIPQLLVGLGLLGTFFGLSIGLSGLDLSSNDKQQLNELIEGTKTAFYTSLYGMYYSLIISVIMNNYIGNYESMILKIKEKINSIFHKYIGNETMEDMKNEIIVLRESQEKLSESVGVELVNGVENYNKINEKYMYQLSKIVNNNIEGLAEKLSKSFEIELKKVFSEDFIAKFSNLKNDLVKFSEVNNASIKLHNKEMKDISNNFNLIGEKLIKFNSETLVTFQEIMDKIENEYRNVNDLLLKSEKNYVKYDNLLSNSQDIMKSSNLYLSKIETITESLNSFVNQEKTLIAFWNSNKDVLERVSNTVSKSSLEIKNATDENTKIAVSLIEKTKESLIQTITQVDKNFKVSLNKQVTEYEEIYNQGLSSLFSNYDENLSKVINRFNVVLQNLANSSVELSATTDIIKTSLVNTNEILVSTFDNQKEQGKVKNEKYKNEINEISRLLNEVVDEFKKQTLVVQDNLKNNSIVINEDANEKS